MLTAWEVLIVSWLIRGKRLCTRCSHIRCWCGLWFCWRPGFFPGPDVIVFIAPFYKLPGLSAVRCHQVNDVIGGLAAMAKTFCPRFCMLGCCPGGQVQAFEVFLPAGSRVNAPALGRCPGPPASPSVRLVHPFCPCWPFLAPGLFLLARSARPSAHRRGWAAAYIRTL